MDDWVPPLKSSLQTSVFPIVLAATSCDLAGARTTMNTATTDTVNMQWTPRLLTQKSGLCIRSYGPVPHFKIRVFSAVIVTAEHHDVLSGIDSRCVGTRTYSGSSGPIRAVPNPRVANKTAPTITADEDNLVLGREARHRHRLPRRRLVRWRQLRPSRPVPGPRVVKQLHRGQVESTEQENPTRGRVVCHCRPCAS